MTSTRRYGGHQYNFICWPVALVSSKLDIDKNEMCTIVNAVSSMNSSGAKTIKKNTNSTQIESQTQRSRAYEVTSFLSTDCELSTETCSKKRF